MSEERLQEIKDSISLQYKVQEANDLNDFNIFTNEEEELVEEIDRLNNMIERLNNQLQQKDNIIKEVREYANNIMFETKAEEKIQDDILEILDKKEFDINLNDIEENAYLFNTINEAVEKMRIATLKDRFEVVLNNNLIEAKDKYTGFRTILGCRVSYDDLDKNISFVVREDNKPTYEELENIIKEVREYIENKEFINYKKNLGNFERMLKHRQDISKIKRK